MLVLGACSDDAASGGEGDDAAGADVAEVGLSPDAEDDTSAASDAQRDADEESDASEDAAPDVDAAIDADVAEDAEVDSSADARDATTDAADADAALQDASDAPEDAAESDVAADTAPSDAGAGCSAGCVPPYMCITGVCQLPLAGTAWAEQEFEIVEPEELVAVFGLIKDLAIGVRFLAFDVNDLPGADLPALYGAVDELDTAVVPPEVSWQEPDELGVVRFRPDRPDDAPLAGDRWITDAFAYDLSARVTIELPGLPTQVASLGLDVVDARIGITLPSEGDIATGSAAGIITRAEAESREMFDSEEVAPLRALLCADDRTYEPEGDVWHLSDLLDCNGAPLDVDTDDDGENDAYRALIAAELERVQVVVP